MCTFVSCYKSNNNNNTCLIFCRSKIKFEISGSMDGPNGIAIETQLFSYQLEPP